jgi:hypothetical protein
MHHAEVIAALGGIERVAAVTGRHPSRVVRWRAEGIPSGHWAALIECARAHGIAAVNFDALAAGAADRSAPPALRRGPKSRVAA